MGSCPEQAGSPPVAFVRSLVCVFKIPFLVIIVFGVNKF